MGTANAGGKQRDEDWDGEDEGEGEGRRDGGMEKDYHLAIVSTNINLCFRVSRYSR